MIEVIFSINVVLRDGPADCRIGSSLSEIRDWVRNVAELISICLAQITIGLLHCGSAHLSILVVRPILAAISLHKRTLLTLAHTAFRAVGAALA